MHFRIKGLPAEPFEPLFAMPGWALEKHGAVRRIADKAGYPCRISLTDAEPRAAYLHIHFAAPGCYAARVDRA